MTNTLTILQHNTLHWPTNKHSLITYYTDIKPDIILLNSHGLKNTESLKIPGYVIHKINTTETISDGSAIAIKHGIFHKLKDDFITDFIAIEVNTTQGPVIIATTYLPPRRPFLPFPDMYKLLNNNIPVYILGDFNCSHTIFGNRNNNTVGKNIAHLINSGNLLHLGPHFPTYIRQGSATNPDKVFSNKQCYHNVQIEAGEVTSSDHIPIILRLSTKPFYIKERETYHYRRANWDLFRNTLEQKTQVKPLHNYTPQQVEEEVTNWINTVKDAMCTAIPKTNFKPFYQTPTTQTIRDLQTQYNALSTNANIYGWTVNNYREYVRIRQELREECKREHSKRWESNIDKTAEISRDTKAFWAKIKKLQGSSINNANYLTDSQGNRYHTDTEKCTLMRDTWSNIFKITAEEEETFDTAHSEHIDTYIDTQHHRTTPYDTTDITRLDTDNLYTRPIQYDDIKKHINKIKHKAPGSSKINKAILEKLPRKSLQQLTNIFNAALSLGYFPDAFKCAIIKLIPKENKSPKSPLNYRPISLLEVPAKIYEKIILQRLNFFLSDNDVIKDRQHGFRPLKGTTTAITVNYETIANALAEKQQTVVVLRDVAKAFDKVWHNGLKYKILRLGLPVILEKILCTFLDNRSAKISIGNNLSEQFNLLSGVPQGSILSPTLYTLYTNDLPTAGPGTTDTMYADDVTQIITTPSKSKNMMKLKVEREISRINRFEKTWKIKTSEEKFKIIPIAQYKTQPIIINNKQINTSKEGKLLGLKLRSTGMVGHATEIVRKGKGIVTKLQRFRQLTPRLKTTLVKTLLIPVLEYPPIPLCSLSKTQKLKIQRVLNKAIRFIHCNEREILTLEELHHKYNITPFNISIHNKSTKIWERIRQINQDQHNNLTRPIHSTHKWFPRSSDIITAQFPTPIYTNI